jgi:predicted anti-sigma-YlaC factor YlaD
VNPSRGQLCDRARRWASLKLDGELSELENALLDSHLSRCAACRGFALEAQGIAAELRSVALERLPAPVELHVPRGPSLGRVTQASVAAALVLVAVVLGSALGVANRGSASQAAAARHIAMIVDSPENLRTLRRAELIASGRPIPRNRLLGA